MVGELPSRPAPLTPSLAATPAGSITVHSADKALKNAVKSVKGGLQTSANDENMPIKGTIKGETYIDEQGAIKFKITGNTTGIANDKIVSLMNSELAKQDQIQTNARSAGSKPIEAAKEIKLDLDLVPKAKGSTPEGAGLI